MTAASSKPTSYVALLRGVNVNGIRITMADLEKVFTDSVFARELAKPRFKATTTTRNMRTLNKILKSLADSFRSARRGEGIWGLVASLSTPPTAP